MTFLKDAWDIIKDRAEWKTVQANAAKVPELERRITALEARLSSGAGDHVCDHCGSTNLARIGSRPSSTPFGKLGEKEAVFRCNDCSRESAFILK